MPSATQAKIAVFTSSTGAARTAVSEPPVLSPDPAVLVRVRELIAARSPEIARPMLDDALAAGTITLAERAALLHEVLGVTDLPPTQLSLAARRLRDHIRAAIALASPALARPLLDEAVAAQRLTPSQSMRIAQHLREPARRPLSSVV